MPVRTLPEFVAFAKANPGKLKVGFAGRGTPQHIGIELFKIITGVDLTLVPYLGSTPALSDLLVGNIRHVRPTTFFHFAPQARGVHPDRSDDCDQVDEFA